MKKTGIFILAGVLLLAAYCGYISHYQAMWRNIPESEIKRGDVRAVLHQKGEVRAVRSTNITPSTWGKLARLVPEGTLVNKDEPVAWIETESLEKELEKARVSLDIAQQKLAKALEEKRLQIKLSELAVEQAEADLKYKKMQLDSAKREMEKISRLVQLQLLPKKKLEDAELEVNSAKLQWENASIALMKAKNQLASQIKLQEADVERARIEVEKAKANFDNAQDNLDNAVIRTPISGIVLYRKIWKSGKREKVQAGDQVGPWQPILQIPDLSEMEVVTMVDEVDIFRLKENMTATIQMDAIPGKVFPGRVSRISTLAKEMDKGGMFGGMNPSRGIGRKVFEVGIHIEDDLGEALKPGITGMVDILIAEAEDVLYVPLEAVFGEGDATYIYIDRLTGPERVPVHVGVTNYRYAAVSGDIEEGMRVFLAVPETTGGAES